MKYKHLAYTLLLALASTLTQAQVKIGKNPTTITPGALLDIEGGTTTTRTVSLTNGNFGIGIVAPVTKLDVGGDIGFYGSRDHGTITGHDNSLFVQTGKTSLSIINNAGTYNIMQIQNNGLVGIGTAAPVTKLDVAGDIGFNGSLTNGTIIGHDNSLFIRTGTSGLSVLNSDQNYNLMQIQNNGLVGIGTAAPISQLDLTGKLRVNDGSQASGRVLTSDANGIATWQSLGGQSGIGFSAFLTPSGPFSINLGGGEVFPFPSITISTSGSYMVVVRTFARASNAGQPAAFYSFIRRNGNNEDKFEWYTAVGYNNVFGVSGTLFFNANAGDVVTVGFNNGYGYQGQNIAVANDFLDRNNVRFVKVN